LRFISSWDFVLTEISSRNKLRHIRVVRIVQAPAQILYELIAAACVEYAHEAHLFNREFFHMVASPFFDLCAALFLPPCRPVAYLFS